MFPMRRLDISLNDDHLAGSTVGVERAEARPHRLHEHRLAAASDARAAAHSPAG
jgi:hypothetical protein